MNRRTVAVGVVLGVLVLTAAAWLQGPTLVLGQAVKDGDKDDKRTLTVSGTGTVRIKPDSARLFFTVESYSDQVRTARADNASKLQKVMKALAELKIAGLKTKSDNVSVQQLTDHNNGRQLPHVIGYHITSSFTVLAEDDDLAKLNADASRMLDAVLENGCTGVSQTVFFKKGADVARLQREAMTKAVEDALANGRAMLVGMNGAKLEPLTMSSEPRHFFPAAHMQNYTNAMNVQQAMIPQGGDGSATLMVAGEMQFTCTVNMTCKY